MKYSEIPDFPFAMGDPETTTRFGAGPSAGPPNSFMANNSSRQIDDESLGYLVEYMELDEFLDECDLRLDANMGEAVTELDIDGFLSTKNDPEPFEIQQNQLKEAEVEAQNNILQKESTPENQNSKRRRVSSTSMASNSNSSTGSTTSPLHTPSNLNIKTDFGGVNGLRSPGAPTFQEIRQQQQSQQTTQQMGSAAQQNTQILIPTKQNKKPQVWPNSQTQPPRVIQPGPSSSPTKQPRKTQRKRQQSAPAPLHVQVDSAVVANTNITVQTTQTTMQQKPSIFIVATPEVPLGTMAPIVQVGSAGSTSAPSTPVTDSIDSNEPNFVIPDSPATPSGKGRRKRKQSISDNMKDDKYWERRRKNNAAAKRSREERLAKEAKIAQQANVLVQENIRLKEELKNAIEENKSLRERLGNYELNDAV